MASHRRRRSLRSCRAALSGMRRLPTLMPAASRCVNASVLRPARDKVRPSVFKRLRRRRARREKRRGIWSIGILRGTGPLDLRAPVPEDNPVLGYAAVTDVVASFVADPFLIRHDGAWYMF